MDVCHVFSMLFAHLLGFLSFSSDICSKLRKFTRDTSDLCLKEEGPSDSRPCPGKPLQRGERDGLTKRIHVRMFFDLAFFVRVNQ